MTDQTYKLPLRGFLGPQLTSSGMTFEEKVSGMTRSGLAVIVRVITLSMQQPNFPVAALIFLISNCSVPPALPTGPAL